MQGDFNDRADKKTIFDTEKVAAEVTNPDAVFNPWYCIQKVAILSLSAVLRYELIGR